ncbi:MAG: methyl-accepting chemotaxis protein [Deltaproteobacteria bacterium]|nr:methyl-accepting chemotaxis protein [Deltaproteobacteria bacterium]
MKNIPLSLKFIFILLISFSIFGGVTYWTLNELKVNGPIYSKIINNKDLVADILPPPEYIIEANLVVHQMMNKSNHPETMKYFQSEGNRLRKEYLDRHAYWEKTLPSGSIKEMLVKKSYEPAIKFFNLRDEKFVPAVLAGDKKAAYELLSGELTHLYNEHRKAIDRAVIDINEHILQEEKSATRIIFRRTVLMIGIGLSLTLISCFLFGRIASGITLKLKDLSSDLQINAQHLLSTAAQVSSISQSLAEGSSAQAAGLEQTSSSMEEMASMTRQNSENADLANTLVQNTDQVLNDANLAMKKLTQSMQEIIAAGEETGKIIKTIDEIAFQTKLLALNAAVEAARAGEAGYGFTVVADEVKNLAMRAAEAAQNTSHLIEGSVRKIKNGSEIVGKTNEAFEKVSGSSKKVGELVSEIAAASQEQAQGIDQITKAVSEIDRVVQKNASTAEESASASEELSTQADQMKHFVHDLVKAIGGNHNGTSQPRLMSGNGGNKRSLTAIGQSDKSNPPQTLIKPGGNGNGKKPAIRTIIPDQLLPMGQGNFKDF